jgi:hypothetical protein
MDTERIHKIIHIDMDAFDGTKRVSCPGREFGLNSGRACGRTHVGV